MIDILSDSSLNNPLWLFILLLSGGIGLWLGYDNNRLKKKYAINEGRDIKIRDDIRNLVFLFLFLVGAFGFLRKLYHLFL